MGKQQQQADDKRSVQSWMSTELMDQIDRAGEVLGWSRSQVIVRACEYWLREFEESPMKALSMPVPPS